MIDWDRVAELGQEVGQDALGEIVEMFLEEVEEVVARLKNAPDPARYEEDLHFLKGSALNLGFRAFSDLCEIGEKTAAGGRGELVDLGPILETYDTSKANFLDKFENMGYAA